MTFIPSQIKIGDRVRLKADQENCNGVFTKGHEFTVIAWSERGMDLVDDDGNCLTECILIHDKIEKIIR